MDVIRGDFAYLGWKDAWIIIIGFESSFSAHPPLLNIMPLGKPSSHWIPQWSSRWGTIF